MASGKKGKGGREVKKRGRDSGDEEVRFQHLQRV
jgi:hypothetical protein